MKEQPNLIIFRVPDEDGDMVFVEVPYLDGKLHENGTKFILNSAEDTYLTMGFNHVVLARTTAEGSLDLAKCSLVNGEEDAVVHTIQYGDLKRIVEELVRVYNSNEI